MADVLSSKVLSSKAAHPGGFHASRWSLRFARRSESSSCASTSAADATLRLLNVRKAPRAFLSGADMESANFFRDIANFGSGRVVSVG